MTIRIQPARLATISTMLDGKLEDIQTAMEKEMAQTTLKDVVKDTQKRMNLESVS